jgi:hypothetical protein
MILALPLSILGLALVSLSLVLAHRDSLAR